MKAAPAAMCNTGCCPCSDNRCIAVSLATRTPTTLNGLPKTRLCVSSSGGKVLISPNPPMRSGLGVRTRGEGRGTRRSALDSDKWGRWRSWAAALGRGRRDSMQGKTIADRAGATLWGGWVVWWTGHPPLTIPYMPHIVP